MAAGDMMNFPGRRTGAMRRMLGWLICAGAVQAASAEAISPAEVLLFQTNHLQNVQPPVTLTYSFKKLSSDEPGFDDEVQLDVKGINPDRSAVVAMRFLSGARKLAIPEAENSEGNPVLLGFLERDIGEMQRLTGGTSSYFRKRIRMALAQGAQVRPVAFTCMGKRLEGQEVTIQPYLNDPLHQRFEKYVSKRYVFVISEQLAGGLYQIRASSRTVPADTALMDETLTLVKEERH